MNAKLQKFYQNIFEFAKEDFENNPETILDFLSKALSFDYLTAIDLWEFLFLENENGLAKNLNLAKTLGEGCYNLFCEKNEQKTQRALIENASLRRAVFACCPNACTGLSFKLVVDLLYANKTVEAEELLKCLVKNTVSESYGKLLREVVERLLIELMKKANNLGKKIEMPKKTSTMLLVYIAKIKGAERAILEQRIREIN